MFNKLCLSFSRRISDVFQCYQGVAVACSGGLDSTVLFHIIRICAKKRPLAICHVNFGLRGKESQEDEDFLRAMGEAYGIPFWFRRAPTAPPTGIQAWARQVRYDWWEELGRQGWLIALGHHGDDGAENVLLRLMRGSFPSGIRGMSGWNPPYWRPFLELGLFRKDLEKICQEKKWAYRKDSSNDSEDYGRNVLRHRVLPVLENLAPGAGKRIWETSEMIEDLAQWHRSESWTRFWTWQEVQTLPLGVLCERIACLYHPSRGRLYQKLLCQTLKRLKDCPQKRHGKRYQVGENLYLLCHQRGMQISHF